jgi:hypothetical protein
MANISLKVKESLLGDDSHGFRSPPYLTNGSLLFQQQSSLCSCLKSTGKMFIMVIERGCIKGADLGAAVLRRPGVS